jgi:hypothetical protein
MKRERMNKKYLTVFIPAYQLEETGKLRKIKDVETPLELVEEIENFKENLFWLKIKDLWALIGKIPPFEPSVNDLILSKDKNQWGLFIYLGEDGDKILLQDGKGERKSKVDKEVINQLNFYGKVIKVLKRV